MTVGQESLLESVKNCVGLKLSFLFLLRHAFKPKTLRLLKKIAAATWHMKKKQSPRRFLQRGCSELVEPLFREKVSGFL